MNFILPEQLAQKLVAYLGTKPYQEVYLLLAEIQKLTPKTKEDA